jgi:hypothetical protein
MLYKVSWCNDVMIQLTLATLPNIFFVTCHCIWNCNNMINLQFNPHTWKVADAKLKVTTLNLCPRVKCIVYCTGMGIPAGFARVWVYPRVLHGYGYTRGFCTGTAMGMGTGTRILTRQISVPVAVPVTKKLDFLEFKLLSEFKLTSPAYLTKQGKFLCFEWSWSAHSFHAAMNVSRTRGPNLHHAWQWQRPPSPHLTTPLHHQTPLLPHPWQQQQQPDHYHMTTAMTHFLMPNHHHNHPIPQWPPHTPMTTPPPTTTDTICSLTSDDHDCHLPWPWPLTPNYDHPTTDHHWHHHPMPSPTTPDDNDDDPALAHLPHLWQPPHARSLAHDNNNDQGLWSSGVRQVGWWGVMVVGGKGAQGQVVVVVRCEGAGGGHCRVVVVGWSLSLLWVREWRWWVMEWGGWK